MLTCIQSLWNQEFLQQGVLSVVSEARASTGHMQMEHMLLAVPTNARRSLEGTVW